MIELLDEQRHYNLAQSQYVYTSVDHIAEDSWLAASCHLAHIACEEGLAET